MTNTDKVAATYTATGKTGHVVDSHSAADFDPVMFEPEYWSARGEIAGFDGGRGRVCFVTHGEVEWALRHFHRGGTVARFVDDRYLWTGAQRTRSMREWQLLADLYNEGLPVPRPIAAGYRRSGLLYRADIITQRLPARALSRQATQRRIETAEWAAIGRCIRRFHDAGVSHADLNAHNILLGESNDVWLIDFDRGTRYASGTWRKANLARLLRSLHKIGMGLTDPDFEKNQWSVVLDAYGGGN